MVMTFGGEVWANDLPYHWDKEPALEWYFEVRSTTFDSWPDHAVVEWGEWGFEYKSPYSFHHGYKYAKSMLSQFRLGHENPICDNWKWEYRATLRKIT